jgi:hypothetical protein
VCYLISLQSVISNEKRVILSLIFYNGSFLPLSWSLRQYGVHLRLYFVGMLEDIITFYLAFGGGGGGGGGVLQNVGININIH